MTTKSKKRIKSIPQEKFLLQELMDPGFAEAFVLETLHLGSPVQHALRPVVKAHGLNKIARLTGLAKPNLVRALHPDANPTARTLNKILKAVGLELSVRRAA